MFNEEVFVGYDNPNLAMQVYIPYETEGVIPPEDMGVAIKCCSTVKDLIVRLKELDVEHGVLSIFSEFNQTLRRPGAKSELVEHRVDRASGYWSNGIRALEEKR